MAWVITEDKILNEDNGACSRDWSPALSEDMKEELPYQFRMYDDDGELYYEGRASEECFEPLDDFGTPNAGCTEIKFRVPGTNRWRRL